ncbi:uncharacterized protein LOC590448 [Strongylocentrotus purpuratus]|uniref:Homeobox domain-containing protein n=1 Tax=Strongylocentrotus purpuratus TaxID=7668 RepID=A0A7M7RH46_STRPU|nr:uncharacterized protein LOC590448 [Strongylocentrotus purpuratus]
MHNSTSPRESLFEEFQLDQFLSNKTTDTTMTTLLPSSYSQPMKKQIEILEAEFIINSRPDITTRDRLAHTLKLSNLLIHVWFRNRRLRPSRSPPQKVVLQTSKVDMNDHPNDLAVSKKNADVRKSSCNVADHPIDLSISSKASRKRKSPCDIKDHERTHQPYEKPDIIPTSMTSSSYHPSDSGAIQHRASRDRPSGPISSLMSVDFLSRSSRIDRTPSRDVIHLFRTPVFYSSVAFPHVTYYRRYNDL